MNYIVMGSLSMSVVGLFLIYITASNIEPSKIAIGEINGELIGATVTSEGYIKSENMNENGHMFLTIVDGKNSISVPVFSNVMKDLNEEDFKVKSKIKVTGVVDEYKSQFQIIPRKPNDIVLGN